MRELGSAVSFVFALLLCIAVAKRFRRGEQQWWAAVAAFAAPWGLIANLGALTPVRWILAQAVFLLAAWLLPGDWFPIRRPGWPRNAFLFPIAAVLVLLGVHQWRLPIGPGDEAHYHASRVLYWIGKQSVAWFPTHNDRQNVFGYQGELAFLWPVLFTKSEAVGRMVFWLAVPLSVLAVFHLTQLWGGRRRLGAVCAGLFLAVPIVLRHGVGLKPEMWSCAFVVVTIWWLVTATRSKSAADWLMAGVFAALSVHTKSTALVLLPVVFFCGRRWAITGFAAAALLIGIVPLSVQNWMHHGHPMGPEALRKVLSEPSLQQVRTHAVRLPLLLTEFPSAPPEEIRLGAESAGLGLLAITGTSAPLPLEDVPGWPGAFTFRIPDRARNYSLGGLFLLLVLVAGWFVRGRTITPSWVALGLLFCGVGLIVRWQVHSGLPERMLLPCFALAMGLLPVFLPRRAFWPLVASLVWTAFYPAQELLQTRDPVPDAAREAPFHEALAYIPAGSRVLLFAEQDTPDYPLFGPLDGYTRQIEPWGKRPFNADLFRDTLERSRITHILLLRDEFLYYHWDPPLDVRPFLRALSGLAEVPLSTPGMRLLLTRYAPSAPIAPRHLSLEAPAAGPLLFVAKELGAGIFTGGISTPWPIENLGGEEGGFLWLGSGQEEGLSFYVDSSTDILADVVLRVQPGPSRSGALRHIVVKDVFGEQRASSDGSSPIQIAIGLKRGRNQLTVYSSDTATNAAPGGDPRRLIAGLQEIRIVPSVSAGDLVQIKGWRVSGLKPSTRVEDLGGREREFLWLGSLEFNLTPSGAAPSGGLLLVLSPGPSRTDAGRNVKVTIGGESKMHRIAKVGETVYVPLTSGRRVLSVRIEAADPPTVLKQPNGDARPLVVGLHEIRWAEGGN